MSGEKRTKVEILEDDMRQNRRQLYNMQQQHEQLQEALEQARRDNRVHVNTLRSQMEEREKKQAAVNASLQTDMQEMDKRHHRQLNEQRKKMLSEMQQMEGRVNEKVDDLRSWTQNKLSEQRREYTQVLQQHQKELNLLKQEISSINQREENREIRASHYYGDLMKLIQSADTNIPHGRFAPGRLEKIIIKAAAGKGHLEGNDSSAAIAILQMAHFELMDLEAEVAQLEAEFELTWRSIADTVGGLLSLVRKNRQIQLEGQSVEKEADFWTQGRYTLAEKRLEEIQHIITEEKGSLTTRQLHAYLDEAGELNTLQEKLINEAVERIISSQLRAEMADVVIDQLKNQGFVIKGTEIGYAANDQRNAYMVKLHNVAGTEIVTVITPDEETCQNHLSINTYNDHTFDDRAKKSRNSDILKTLKQGGLHTGETECNDAGVEEFYDVAAILKSENAHLSQQLKQRIASTAMPQTTSGNQANQN